MIGGWMMNTSRFAIPAAVALLVSGLALSPARAADLGGDCCADLEERVSELEATTARKGNKKVSLRISGFVSKSVMWWNDGEDSDAYVVETNSSTLVTNVTFSGQAQINSDWSAGYQITVEFDGGTNANIVTATNDNASDGDNNTLVSALWVKSNRLGKVTVGKHSQASDNAALLPDLSGTIIQANYVQFQGLVFGINNSAGGASGLAWHSLQGCGTLLGIGGLGIGLDCNGVPLNNVRYDTPTIAGFTASASWGEDDFWDVALAYAGSFGDFKAKAAYAYSVVQDENYDTGAPAGISVAIDVDLHQVGASLLHVPSGIFVYGAYATEDVSVAGVTGLAELDAYYVKAGIQQNLTSLGKTIIYGEYKNVEDGHITQDVADRGLFLDADGAAVAATTNNITGSEYEQYGVGVVQYVDAAAMQLHLFWKHFEADVTVAAGSSLNDGTAGSLGLEDLDIVSAGATIFF